METEFIKLNPMLSHSIIGYELIFKCPHCANHVSIRVNLNGPPIPPSIWGLEVEIDKGWETATITPSVNDHPLFKRRSGCHFSIIKGKIYA